MGGLHFSPPPNNHERAESNSSCAFWLPKSFREVPVSCPVCGLPVRWASGQVFSQRPPFSSGRPHQRALPSHLHHSHFFGG
jgi:hypothetical protein